MQLILDYQFWRGIGRINPEQFPGIWSKGEHRELIYRANQQCRRRRIDLLVNNRERKAIAGIEITIRIFLNMSDSIGMGQLSVPFASRTLSDLLRAHCSSGERCQMGHLRTLSSSSASVSSGDAIITTLCRSAISSNAWRSRCAPTARNTSGGRIHPDSCRFDLVADRRSCRVTGGTEAL